MPDGHLGSCAVMLDGLPPQESTLLAIDLGEEQASVVAADASAVAWRSCTAPDEQRVSRARLCSSSPACLLWASVFTGR